MYYPKKLFIKKDLDIAHFKNLGRYIKSMQYESGAIPSDDDGFHDPWDHMDSIMGLSLSLIHI